MALSVITKDYIPKDIILHSNENRTVKETICDVNNNALYSLPQITPSNPSLLEVLPNGEAVWIDASSLIGNPNALISTNPLVPPIAGSVVVYTGDSSNLDVNSQEILVVDTITNAVKINDASSSEFTTITTNNATYINHNGGSSGLVLDAGTGDLTLASTKFQGVVNVNSFNGLQFNGVGLINNINSDLRMFNGDGDVFIESKQNNVVLRVSEEVIYDNLATGANYRIVPTAQPADNSIVQYQSNGECAFIPTPSGGGSANAFINSQPLTVPATGSVLIADGAGSAFNSQPSNNTSIDSNGLRLYGAGIQIVSLLGCDTRITQENDCNFNISNNSNGNIKLKCGGVLQVQGSAGGTYSLPNVNFSMPNQGDTISFNSDGTSEFTSPTIPNLLQSFYVSKLGSDTNNGSAVSPFLTITYALSQANLLSASTKTTIYILAGIFTEDLTISKNNLTLSGASAIAQMTVINGIVSYNIDGGGSRISSSLFGLSINGINLFGSSYNDDGSFVIGACVLGSNAGVVPLNILYNGSGIRDYTLNNTVIYGVNTNAVYINKGTINATACVFSETTTSNIYPIVEVVQSGVLNLFGTVVLSLNATASAPPVVRFTNNVATSCQFNSSTIGYAFGTIDTQVVKTKVCVACRNTAALTLTVFNNKFDGTGSRIAYVGVNYVVISKEGSALTINYAQNIGTSTANGVHHYPIVAGATRTQLITVI